MKDFDGALTPKQEKAISALMSEPTIRDAAKKACISETTLWRWLQLEEFQARYRAAQRAVVNAAIKELQAATLEAVKTLKRNLSCGNFFAENAAAQSILTQSFKAIELVELQERIERLEVQLNSHGESRSRPKEVSGKQR